MKETDREVRNVLLDVIGSICYADFAPANCYHNRDQVVRMLDTMDYHADNLVSELGLNGHELVALRLACVMNAAHRYIRRRSAYKPGPESCCLGLALPHSETAANAIRLCRKPTIEIIQRGDRVAMALHDINLAVWTQYTPQDAVGRLGRELYPAKPNRVFPSVRAMYEDVLRDATGKWCSEALSKVFAGTLYTQAGCWLSNHKE